ncbi:hypothetical protein MRX96_013511 [Rhipicephalus microplus]
MRASPYGRGFPPSGDNQARCSHTGGIHHDDCQAVGNWHYRLAVAFDCFIGRHSRVHRCISTSSTARGTREDNDDQKTLAASREYLAFNSFGKRTTHDCSLYARKKEKKRPNQG